MRLSAIMTSFARVPRSQTTTHARACNLRRFWDGPLRGGCGDRDISTGGCALPASYLESRLRYLRSRILKAPDLSRRVDRRPRSRGRPATAASPRQHRQPVARAFDRGYEVRSVGKQASGSCSSREILSKACSLYGPIGMNTKEQIAQAIAAAQVTSSAGISPHFRTSVQSNSPSAWALSNHHGITRAPRQEAPGLPRSDTPCERPQILDPASACTLAV